MRHDPQTAPPGIICHLAEQEFFELLDRLPAHLESEVLLVIRTWIDVALDLARDRQQLFAHAKTSWNTRST